MARLRDVDEQRQRLTEATWSVLTERGLAGLTIRAVAERAGCTTGLVMHTFPTKDALLLHARDTMHERTRVKADAAEASGEGDPVAALRAVLLNALSLDQQGSEEARVWVGYLAASVGDETLAARHTTANRRFVERVTRLVAACRPQWEPARVHVEALSLIALTDGFNALATADPETYSPEVQRRAVTDALTRALGDTPAERAAAGAQGMGAEPSAGGSRMLVRAFGHADTDAVIALWEAAGLTRPWNDPRLDIARKFTVQPELFVVGEIDGRLAATAMAGYDGHRGWVNYLAVDAAQRGRGYGRELMQHLEHELRARGCPKLNLQIRAGNEEVAAFYRALGYTPDGAVSMGKRLIAD
jgi:AcrR family transcriptional regulator